MPHQQKMPPQKPQKRRADTPFRTRVIMAATAVSILLALFYFFNGMQFPAEITYKNVRGGAGPYAHRHESPRMVRPR